ncbi:MAG: transglutaminase family protein [Gammaproteobacteria bacterium]
MPAWRFLAERGFAGDTGRYDAPDNSHLGRVLEQRAGLPITLAVLLVSVAEKAGADAVGINFPGHFLARVDGTLIDPFVMRPIDADDARSGLPADLRTARDEILFAVANPRAIVLRMLNNLKGTFAARSAWHRVLDAIDAQMAVEPGSTALGLYERGEIGLRMGSPTLARADFEAAQARLHAGDVPAGIKVDALLARLDQRLAGLDGASDVIH